MDISLIPIQRECKFYEHTLKHLSTKDPEGPISSDCYSAYREIEEFPGARYLVYLDVSTENNVSYFSPRLQLYNIENQCIRGTCGFYIKSANYASSFGSELFKCDLGEMDGSSSYEYGCKICTFEDLLNVENKFIVNGECCIEVKGIFHLKSSVETCEPQQTLGQYLWNRDDHDFTILVGKENESKTEIKVHKCVLGARSPVFDAMVYTNMKEKAENKVDIIDFDVQTVKTAIAFCYDQNYDDLLNDVTDATTLLQFADKYDIQDLKNKIERYLVTEAVPKDICQIANASIISNSIKLRDFCIQKMIMFSKMEISIDNIENLDKDFAMELIKKTFTFKK